MYTEDSTLDECTILWSRCFELTKIFIKDAPKKSNDLILPSESVIEFNANKSLYIIKNGILKESYNDDVIINYEEGDLVGADAFLQNKLTHISTDFSVTVDEYDSQLLIQHIRTDEKRNQAWNQFLMTLIQSYQLLMCHHKKSEALFHPEIKQFDKGDIIIKEGDTDDAVFTLISGSALVFVGETEVGAIQRDEVFGHIAAFTKTPRTATIKADSPCSVLVVASSRFKDLLTSRPDIVTKLIEDMARSIVSGNEKIISLSK